MHCLNPSFDVGINLGSIDEEDCDEKDSETKKNLGNGEEVRKVKELMRFEPLTSVSELKIGPFGQLNPLVNFFTSIILQHLLSMR